MNTPRDDKDFWGSVDWRSFPDVVHTQFSHPADRLLRRRHTLSAISWTSRLRIACIFISLAWRILIRGRASIRL